MMITRRRKRSTVLIQAACLTRMTDLRSRTLTPACLCLRTKTTLIPRRQTVRGRLRMRMRKRYGSSTEIIPAGRAAADTLYCRKRTPTKINTTNSYVKRMQGDYSYDPNTDPNTKYYTAAYRREGQRAAQDTMGAIAAATGGIPSSYAAAAAQQASNYYAQQLADKYPELYQQAYNNFLSEYSRASDTLSQLSALEQNDYNKYLYDQQFKRQDRQEQREITQQQLENAYYEAQQKFDVDYRLRQLDQNERAMVQDIAYKYAALEQSGKQADKELQYRYAALSQQQKALVDELAYKYAAMGQTDLQNQRELDYQLALIGAENGDFSGLRNLGIDTSKQEEYYNAVVQAELNSLREQELTDDDVFLTLYDGKLTNDEKRLWEEKIEKVNVVQPLT